jgi:phage terminase small subunit
MQDPRIKQRIDKLREDFSAIFKLEIADLLREWLDIARADPNEIVSYRRRCCRHCWGTGGAYQWLDEREFADALADAMDENAQRRRTGGVVRELPDDSGGYGFDHTKPPVINCTHCRGEGVGAVVVNDTTQLSGPAAKLYAGVKVGKGGQIEVLMRDQDAALANLARALGAFDPKPKQESAQSDPVEFMNELQKFLPN